MVGCLQSLTDASIGIQDWESVIQLINRYRIWKSTLKKQSKEAEFLHKSYHESFEIKVELLAAALEAVA